MHAAVAADMLLVCCCFLHITMHHGTYACLSLTAIVRTATGIPSDIKLPRITSTKTGHHPLHGTQIQALLQL
jgi:hypothetical protein